MTAQGPERGQTCPACGEEGTIWVDGIGTGPDRVLVAFCSWCETTSPAVQLDPSNDAPPVEQVLRGWRESWDLVLERPTVCPACDTDGRLVVEQGIDPEPWAWIGFLWCHSCRERGPKVRSFPPLPETPMPRWAMNPWDRDDPADDPSLRKRAWIAWKYGKESL